MRGTSEAFGPYVVYEQIGLGGMATVHRAETQGLAGFSKPVALKRMLPNVAADAKLVQSFIREARLASYLRHANVAQTYDLGKVGDTYFIAMELVPGPNLLTILRHCASVAGHMPLPIAMNVVKQIADALDYAHNLCDDTGAPLGIIHRDVSPANVIVSEGGLVKLIDFGIAKASGAGLQTLSGTVKGKFSYLAPECLEGNVDARSDLFALGVIAHELLANRPLFQGSDDMDTLYRVKDMPIIPPSHINPQVPAEIESIIMTALERDPRRRWQDAKTMRQALAHQTQRLGVAATNLKVQEWIDTTFVHAVVHEEESSIAVNKHTVELAQGSLPDESNPADSMETIVRPAGSKPIQQQRPAVAASEWKVTTDVTSNKAPIADSTVTDPDAVADDTGLEQATVAAVYTPSADEWEGPNVIQTREVRTPVPVAARQLSQPHVVPRVKPASEPTGVRAIKDLADVTTQPSVPQFVPARASGPAIKDLADVTTQPTASQFAGDTSPTLPDAQKPRPSAPALPLPSSPLPHRVLTQRPSPLPSTTTTTRPSTQGPTEPLPNTYPVQRPSPPPPSPHTRPSSMQPAQTRPSAPQPAQTRTSAPQLAQTRASAPHLAQTRTSAPQLAQAPEPSVPKPPPIRPGSPGAHVEPKRTASIAAPTPIAAEMDAATTTDLAGDKAAMLDQVGVGRVLDDLDQPSGVDPNVILLSKKTTAGRAAALRLDTDNFLLALLVLIAAGAAAVVYFALPYLT